VNFVDIIVFAIVNISKFVDITVYISAYYVTEE